LDALSDVLRLVRLTGAVFLDAEFTTPWCISAPSGKVVCTRDMPQAQHVVIYHLITAGTCEVMFGGEAPRTVQCDDLIVIPGGTRMSSATTWPHNVRTSRAWSSSAIPRRFHA
jgi:hypothetical protein